MEEFVNLKTLAGIKAEFISELKFELCQSVKEELRAGAENDINALKKEVVDPMLAQLTLLFGKLDMLVNLWEAAGNVPSLSNQLEKQSEEIPTNPEALISGITVKANPLENVQNKTQRMYNAPIQENVHESGKTLHIRETIENQGNLQQAVILEKHSKRIEPNDQEMTKETVLSAQDASPLVLRRPLSLGEASIQRPSYTRILSAPATSASFSFAFGTDQYNFQNTTNIDILESSVGDGHEKGLIRNRVRRIHPNIAKLQEQLQNKSSMQRERSSSCTLPHNYCYAEERRQSIANIQGFTDNIGIADTARLAFIDQAKYWLENSYPDWRDTYNSSPNKYCETICIPDALDVLPNRRHEAQRMFDARFASEDPFMSSGTKEIIKTQKKVLNKSLVGQQGEDNIFSAFRRLELGGILIAGFDTQNFIMKMKKERMPNSDYGVWKKKGHFECYAIFFHHQLGAFIIETKGCNYKKTVGKRFNKAVIQLNKRISGMKEIYRLITGEDCPIEFQGVVCIPNAIVTQVHDTYKVLGKSQIEDPEFRKFWLPKEAQRETVASEELPKDRNLISDSFFSFLATVIGYRSAKFASMPSNALEIYRIIDDQSFNRIGKLNNARNRETDQQESTKSEAVLLNKEQLKAAECTKPHIFISGPPGTGKTSVMLVRALNSAKVEKPGRVIIISGHHFGKHLKSLFQKFIDNNRNDEIKREVIVTDSVSDVLPRKPLNLDDDIFCDEAPIDTVFLQKYFEEQSTFEESGTTTVVLTGSLDTLEAVANIKRALDLFSGYHHIELKTVIRGTHSIIKEWQRFFPHGFFTIGHSVKGSSVERLSVDVSDLMLTVEKKVRYLLGNQTTGHNSFEDFTCQPCHIAIIVLFEMSVEIIPDIKKRLTSNGFSCGSISEQLNNRNLIAIGDHYEVLSFDWPVVIYVTRIADVNGRNCELVAVSRCISKLIIIEAFDA